MPRLAIKLGCETLLDADIHMTACMINYCVMQGDVKYALLWCTSAWQCLSGKGVETAWLLIGSELAASMDSCDAPAFAVIQLWKRLNPPYP